MFNLLSIPPYQLFSSMFPLKLNSNLSSNILESNSAIQLKISLSSTFINEKKNFNFIFGLAVMKDQRSDAVVIQFE